MKVVEPPDYNSSRKQTRNSEGTLVGAPKRSAIKRIALWISAAFTLVIGAIVVMVLVSGCTSFGKTPDGAHLERIQHSPQWSEDKFHNRHPMWIDTSNVFLRSLFESYDNVSPTAPIPRVTDTLFINPPLTGLRITWLGHSFMLVEIDGSTLLIDPVWSERSSPFAWIGPKRWYEAPLALEDLPAIDSVLISHDHYDHLDHASIVKMKNWDTRFVVPLGVGAHLQHWGIAPTRITELDWWDKINVNGIDIVATPSRHASGRLSPNSDLTLWAGFAMIGLQHRVYYSGDTGFFPELSEIGERLGPFDVTMMDAGQYNADWPDWHLGPEHAVQAHQLVKGNILMPVHWGLFELALHSWTEPIERVQAAARCFDIPVLMPKPGQSVEPLQHPQLTPWWPQLPWQTAQQYPILATQDGNPEERVEPLRCPDKS